MHKKQAPTCNTFFFLALSEPLLLLFFRLLVRCQYLGVLSPDAGQGLGDERLALLRVAAAHLAHGLVPQAVDARDVLREQFAQARLDVAAQRAGPQDDGKVHDAPCQKGVRVRAHKDLEPLGHRAAAGAPVKVLPFVALDAMQQHLVDVNHQQLAARRRRRHLNQPEETKQNETK